MRIYYPSQPEWRYLHTCPECGCHNVSSVALMPWYPFEAKKVCSLCGVSYSEIEERDGLRRRSKERHLTASEWEIDRAIRRASRPQQEWVRLPENLPSLPPSGSGLSKPSNPPVVEPRGGERNSHFRSHREQQPLSLHDRRGSPRSGSGQISFPAKVKKKSSRMRKVSGGQDGRTNTRKKVSARSMQREHLRERD